MSYFPFRDYHAEARRRRREMSTPRALRSLLESAQNKIHHSKTSCQGALPPTTIAKEVNHYSQRWLELGLDGPYPKNAPPITAEQADDIAVRINAAGQYLALATEADELVRPVLLYYSCANVVAAQCRSFFTWEKYREAHGLSCDGGTDVWTTRVTIKKNGAFARLVTTMFLLTGKPTPFDRLVAYSQGPTASGQKETNDPVHQLTLRELADFDLVAKDLAVGEAFGLQGGVATSEISFYVDTMVLFAASHLARYKPVLWRSVLDGRTNDSRLVFDDAFERYSMFGFDRVLAILAEPEKARQQGIGWTVEYYDNPYGEAAIRRRAQHPTE